MSILLKTLLLSNAPQIPYPQPQVNPFITTHLKNFGLHKALQKFIHGFDRVLIWISFLFRLTIASFQSGMAAFTYL